MLYRACTLAVASFLLSATAIAQTRVYDNQANYSGTFLSSFVGSPEWDDLQIVGGGTLSEISFATRHTTGGSPSVSGLFDLRIFDESLGAPQGQSLGVFPFSGVFPLDPSDPFNQRVLIELPGLESLGITLPQNARLGAAVQFNTSGWRLLGAGPPAVGTSPGGNWVGTSTFERNEGGGDFAWALSAITQPVGPGVGSYNVFQTAFAAPDNPTGSSGGIIDGGFFRGVNFEIRRPTTISEVGGYFDGSGAMYAAILPATGTFDPPTVAELDGPGVIATSLFNLPGGFDGSDVTVDLEATLQPGFYSLVFGTNRFGAVGGDGTVRFEQIPNGEWFHYGVRESDGVSTYSAGRSRYFVNAKSAPGTLQVRPTFDVLAEVTRNDFNNDPEAIRLIDGDESILVDAAGSAEEPEMAAVLEFSLSQVPLGRSIQRVTLEVDVNLLSHSGALELDIEGYAGDGVPRLGDAAGYKQVVGVTGLTASGMQTFEIDPEFVADLIGAASHLGLTIRPDEAGNFRFGTLEGGQFLDAPLLTIELGPSNGDYNGDGVVDAADYTLWRDTQGTNVAPGSAADGDGDGVVGEGDYAIWAATYGQRSATPSAGAPEPSSAVMVLVATVLLTGSLRTEFMASRTIIF